MWRPKGREAHLRLQHQYVEHHGGLRWRLHHLHLNAVRRKAGCLQGDLAKMSSERIKELESQIAELKSRWPAHSVPPMMLQQLEELEEELEKELKKTVGCRTDAQADGRG
jgi:hypothetical protein